MVWDWGCSLVTSLGIMGTVVMAETMVEETTEEEMAAFSDCLSVCLLPQLGVLWRYSSVDFKLSASSPFLLLSSYQYVQNTRALY